MTLTIEPSAGNRGSYKHYVRPDIEHIVAAKMYAAFYEHIIHTSESLVDRDKSATDKLEITAYIDKSKPERMMFRANHHDEGKVAQAEAVRQAIEQHFGDIMNHMAASGAQKAFTQYSIPLDRIATLTDRLHTLLSQHDLVSDINLDEAERQFLEMRPSGYFTELDVNIQRALLQEVESIDLNTASGKFVGALATITFHGNIEDITVKALREHFEVLGLELNRTASNQTLEISNRAIPTGDCLDAEVLQSVAKGVSELCQMSDLIPHGKK